MTFSPHGNLTKSLLLATDTYNSQGKKERKKKNERKKIKDKIMLDNSQVANKPNTFFNQQVLSQERSHFVVCMLPFSRICNLRTVSLPL